MTTQPHLPNLWIERLCALLRIPLHGENPPARELFDAWQVAEGGSASNNPLNTTYPLPGATLYNSARVMNYPSGVSGICGTALTLVLHYYVGILGDLQGGKKSALQIVRDNRGAFDTWGTTGALIEKVLTQ